MLCVQIHLLGRPAGEDQQWVHLGRSQFRWLSDIPPGSPANPTFAGKPQQHDAIGWRVRVFWPAMGRWYQGKVKDFDLSTGTRHCAAFFSPSALIQKGFSVSCRQ